MCTQSYNKLKLKMKDEGIKIRIDQKLKKEFEEICDVESTTMSNKIHDFIFKEVELKKPKDIKKIIEKMLHALKYENIKIIDTGTVYVDMENNVLDFEDGQILQKYGKARVIMVCSYGMSFDDFLEKSKNKKTILNFLSSEFDKNHIRGYIFENIQQ